LINLSQAGRAAKYMSLKKSELTGLIKILSDNPNNSWATSILLVCPPQPAM
jgi:hypothetical protein